MLKTTISPSYAVLKKAELILWYFFYSNDFLQYKNSKSD